MVERFYNNVFLALYNKNPAIFAIFLVAGGYLIFNITDAIVKGYTERLDVGNILFWNTLFNFISMLIFCKMVGFKKIWRREKLNWHLLRGLFCLGTCMCGIMALKELQLANFYAIVFLSPMVCVLFGRIFFKDFVDTKKMMAVILGFLGILIVVQPGSMSFSFGALMALGLVICLASSLMIVRKIGKEEPKLLFSLVVSAVTLVGTLIFALSTEGITLPSLADLIVFAGVGTLVSIASTGISTGFQISPSTATVAPFHYVQIVGGIILGYLLWDDLPTLTTLGGAAVVISSGVWIILMEKGTKSPVAASLDEILEQHSSKNRAPLGRDAIPPEVWEALNEEQRNMLELRLSKASAQP